MYSNNHAERLYVLICAYTHVQACKSKRRYIYTFLNTYNLAAGLFESVLRSDLFISLMVYLFVTVRRLTVKVVVDSISPVKNVMNQGLSCKPVRANKIKWSFYNNFYCKWGLWHHGLPLGAPVHRAGIRARRHASPPAKHQMFITIMNYCFLSAHICY